MLLGNGVFARRLRIFELYLENIQEQRSINCVDECDKAYTRS